MREEMKMGEIYVRIDDRLIHGQTIVAWCPTLNIKEIIAVDDISAKNPMLKNIMAMSVPSIYNTHIVTTSEAKELLSKEYSGNRLLIVKTPKILRELKEEIKEAKAIMLGNLAKQADSVHKLDGATGIFYLSEEDVEILEQLAREGADVYFHQLPTSAKIMWETFKKSI